MIKKTLFLWVGFTAIFSLPLCSEEPPKKWIVNYSPKVSMEELEPYSLIVLDGENPPDFDNFQKRGVPVFGYLNLAEIEKERPYYSNVEKLEVIAKENSQWPGSYIIDPRNIRWPEFVIERLAPKILIRQFDGLFLDTADSAIDLEEQDPKKYAGAKQALIDLILALRHNYPEVSLILNRGYAILPEVANAIDYLLGESVYSTYDFEKKSYKRVADSDYRQQVKILQSAQRLNPKLQVLTLDYWDPEDQGTVRQIYAVERENGFIPYVSTIDLQKVIPEPAP